MIILICLINVLFLLLLLQSVKKQNKKLHKMLKKLAVLKCANNQLLLTKTQFTNFFVMIKHTRVKQFVPFYSQNFGGLKAHKNIIKIYVKNGKEQSISICSGNTNATVTFVFVLKNNQGKKVKNGVVVDGNFFTINNKTNILLKNNKTKLITTLSTNKLSTKTVKFCANNFIFNAMQNNKKELKKGIINKKQFSVDSINNIVKLKLTNIKNLLFDGIKSIKTCKLGCVVNNQFLIKCVNNYYYVYKLGTSNLQGQFATHLSNFFAIKIECKNKFIQHLFNVLLPQLIYEQFKKYFNFEPFSEFIKKTENCNYSLKSSIKHLMAQKKYVQTYNLILHNMLGIKRYNEFGVHFIKNSFNAGKIIVNLFGSQFVLHYYNNKNIISYNNITYENINFIKLKKDDNKQFEINA